MKMAHRFLAVFSVFVGFLLFSARLDAQIPVVLFQDDFASPAIDPAKYQPASPFFEGGVGDIHAQAANGTIEFVGTTSQQWWSGATLRVAPTFTATEQANVAISIDRVAEAGVGTASRSALWVMDETETRYVLFADVRGEEGWRYNRKIGENGDNPTGGGTIITAFDGAAFDDGGLHRMKIVANGQTVRLFLDNQPGPEVKFPFSKLVFHFGSYARANGDTAGTTWDNLRIESLRSTKTLLEDDFSSDTINAGRYQPDSPFFEGGVGDIHAQAGNGVIEFVGTTTQQWWSGATLRVTQTFDATEQTPVMASIDRVAEAGVGTASRSAFWIMDESKTHYVLFADVRGEEGWRYNRKIGENGDNPTGGGTIMTTFDGAAFDDGGLHRMSIIADGKNVRLLLDGIQGAEVKFPHSRIIFQFGSYARANNDTASTTWDNLKIETTVRQTTVVFQDDFSSNTIDPLKYQPDSPFFEGGVGDIHAQAGNGVIEFVGTTTQQWWSGATLRVVPLFEASEASVVTASIDRVSEAGVGTASRSAMWIMDETKTRYVLFADVRGEEGWRYNRKIGENGDNPTGGGTIITAFDGATYDNGGLHRMSMVADGKTVKLLLNGLQGAEVRFPFSPVMFHFGSYARANNDTAHTVWDNLVIETAGGATFSPAALTVRNGQNSSDVTLKIPAGLNSQSAVQVRVVSSAPNIATPVGGTDGSLTLTFAAGGPNTQTFKVRGVALGSANLNIEGDVAGGNQVAVVVTSGPGVILEDNFAAATLDAAKWQVSNVGFETGTGTFTVAPAAGVLEISGFVDTDAWPGAGIRSVNSYAATADINLSVEVDRVAIDQIGTAGRTGVYLTTSDRSRFVFFGQNVGETGWEVNVNPGNPTGGGTAIAAFAGVTDLANHRIKMVANGETVEVFLDGVSGGRHAFAVTTGIFVEIGAYARITGDTVFGQFDNVKIENVLPCTSLSLASVSMTEADAGRQVTVTVPAMLHDAAPLTVNVTSANPAVAVPQGAVGGTLALTFAAGGPSSQTFTVRPAGRGATTINVSSVPANCVAGSLAVEVVAVPETLLSDAFDGDAIDETKWTLENLPFDMFGAGFVSADSALTITNGQAKIFVRAEAGPWPGLGLATKESFNAAATTPVTFEIDRVDLDYVLVTGTDANQRTGVWIREPGGSFIFFGDNVAHNGRNFGWGYNRWDAINPADQGVNIAAFDGGTYDNTGNHRIKVVANGATVKMYVDGVFGAETPFPFSQGLTFAFGAYVFAATDIVHGLFDNALITGGEGAAPARLTVAKQGANIVITWTGPGTLEETDALGTAWRAVTPPPTGNTYTVTAPGAAQRFYRVRQ